MTIWYFSSKFTQSHLRDIHYQRLAPNCCKFNRDVETINWVNACCGSYGTSVWPRRRIRHQSAVTNQACSGIPKQPESRPLTKAKCDAFVTSAYYREFKTVPEHTGNIPRKQRHLDQHQLDIDPTRECQINVWSMSICFVCYKNLNKNYKQTI